MGSGGGASLDTLQLRYYFESKTGEIIKKLSTDTIKLTSGALQCILAEAS